jgi:hypothetical protein
MTKKLNKFLSALKLPLIGAGFVFFIGFGIGSSSVAPDNASVFVDPATHSYFAPPCLAPDQLGLQASRLGVVQESKINPDPACRDAGWFVQYEGSLSELLLQKLGLISQPKSRWLPDGSWI